MLPTATAAILVGGAYVTTDAAAARARAHAQREREGNRLLAATAPAPVSHPVSHEAAPEPGTAAAARPRRAVVIAGDPRIGHERICVTRYADAHLIDRMNDRGQLDDLQHAAAARLYGIFCRAGLEPRLVGELGERRGGQGGELDDATAQARAAYNRLIARHPGHSGALLDAMCHGQHPGVRFLEALQVALTELARAWKLTPRHG